MDRLQDLLIGLAHADPGPFWAGTALVALGALVLLKLGFVAVRHARLLEDIPTSRIRSAAQGYVEFHGHARLLPGPEILAPLSGERCCWWAFVIERRRTEREGGKSQAEWITIERQTSDELFVLDDGTGQCVIDPVGARVVPSLSRRWRGYQPRPQAYRKPSWLELGDYRYSERMIRYGDWVYALGLFQTQTASRDDDESRDVSARLAEWKRDPQRLLHRFDANRDGQIDLQEWEVARREAIAQVRAEQVERSIQPDLHVLSAPRDRRPFILSTKTERELTRGMRWAGMAAIAAGLVLGMAVAVALLARGLP